MLNLYSTMSTTLGDVRVAPKYVNRLKELRARATEIGADDFKLESKVIISAAMLQAKLKHNIDVKFISSLVGIVRASTSKVALLNVTVDGIVKDGISTPKIKQDVIIQLNLGSGIGHDLNEVVANIATIKTQADMDVYLNRNLKMREYYD